MPRKKNLFLRLHILARFLLWGPLSQKQFKVRWRQIAPNLISIWQLILQLPALFLFFLKPLFICIPFPLGPLVAYRLDLVLPRQRFAFLPAVRCSHTTNLLFIIEASLRGSSTEFFSSLKCCHTPLGSLAHSPPQVTFYRFSSPSCFPPQSHRFA